MKKNKLLMIALTIIMAFMIILAVGFLIFTKEKGECLENPFVYSAKITSKEANSNLTCTCHFNDPRMEKFWFNNEKVEIGNYYDQLYHE